MDNIFLLLIIVLMIVVGGIFAKLAKATQVPTIAGILIGGIILGTVGRQFGIDWLTPELITSFPFYKIIYVLVLAPIGFLLTKDVRLGAMKSNFKGSLVITLVELVITFTVIFCAMYILKMSVNEAIIVGIIGCAASIASIIIVMNGLEEKMKAGLLPYMFMNLIFVLLAFGILKNLLTGSGSLATPFIIMIFSLIYGVISGTLLSFLIGKTTNKTAPIVYTLLCTILLLLGSKFLVVDLLVTLTVSGITFINMTVKTTPNKVVEMERGFQKLINICILFFMVDLGMKLNVMLLFNYTILVVAIAYTASRITSRRIGYKLGSLLVKDTKEDVSLLGNLMLPQAGISLTFIAFAYKDGLVSEQTLSMVLATMLITEVIGLIIARKTVVNLIKENAV